MAPSPIPSHSGKGVAKGRGVRSLLGSVADYPVRHSPATPSEKGNLAPFSMPSHSGRGVAKGRGCSLAGLPA